MSLFLIRLAKAVIFLGSFLGFAVQPMLGRTLLPLFGGIASVWVICLATFQVLLLAGYFYAHCLRYGKWQNLHIGLLALSVIWTEIIAVRHTGLKEWVGSMEHPIMSVLLCVLGCVGITYILLSANASLIQAWLVHTHPRVEHDKSSAGKVVLGDVFHLYAISNAGSLMGLLCYPFFVEPFFSITAQWHCFAAFLSMYTVLLAYLKKKLCLMPHANVNQSIELNNKNGDESSHRSKFLWIILPTSSCFLLNAVTTHLTTDVTPIPLLWVLLLAAFLCSYIVGFSASGEKWVTSWCLGSLLPLLGCAVYLGKGGMGGFLGNLSSGLLTVFLSGTFLHSWLYLIRPKGIGLTQFYLFIALGGALGGVTSGIVAPIIFRTALEYVLIVILLGGLCVSWVWSVRNRIDSGFVWGSLGIFSFIVYCCLAESLPTNKKGSTRVYADRSFYGCLSVATISGKTAQTEIPISGFAFSYGGTTHGTQYHEHYLLNKPTTYYGPLGGGFALHQHPKYDTPAPMRVGLVGLGVGTLACWGRTNDVYRFFEINPQVINIACNTNYFRYLSDSLAKIDLVAGDARILLENENATNAPPYDVLIIDAYSGDAIPYHLATREAFELYLNRITTNGVLALHISNWHMDLAPLSKAVAEEFKLHALNVLSDQNGLCLGASWVLLSRTPMSIGTFPVRELDWNQVREIQLPRDEKGSLLHLIRIKNKVSMREQNIDLNHIYQIR